MPYLPHTKRDIAQMLAAIGADGLGVPVDSVFQSVGENGEILEAALVVDSLGELSRAPAIPGDPARVEPTRNKRIAYDVAEEGRVFFAEEKWLPARAERIRGLPDQVLDD